MAIPIRFLIGRCKALTVGKGSMRIIISVRMCGIPLARENGRPFMHVAEGVSCAVQYALGGLQLNIAGKRKLIQSIMRNAEVPLAMILVLRPRLHESQYRNYKPRFYPQPNSSQLRLHSNKLLLTTNRR